MSKIDQVLPQVTKGRASQLATLRRGFVCHKSQCEVGECNTAPLCQHEVEQVTQTRPEPVRQAQGQTGQAAERTSRQSVEELIAERLHDAQGPAVGGKTGRHWQQTSRQCAAYTLGLTPARRVPGARHLSRSLPDTLPAACRQWLQ